MATWKTLIEEEMQKRDESWDDTIHCNISETASNGRRHVDKKNWENEEFNDSFGGTEGVSFILWTKKYIYFPICYDGSEWCASLPRSPNASEKTIHHGGG